MKTSDFMARIKAMCPDFATVDHALTSAADVDLPAAMVTPASMSATPDDLIGAVHNQNVRQVFSVYILLARLQDGYISSNADDLDTLTGQLRAALPGWQIDNDHGPVNFAGGQLDRYHTGLVCWREDYSVETQLRT
jgi:hypothetical protein